MKFYKNSFLKTDKSRTLTATLIVILLLVLIFGLSFLGISCIYWLFTIVMSNFFSIIIPFTWHYAVGVWLVVLLIRFTFSGLNTTISKN